MASRRAARAPALLLPLALVAPLLLVAAPAQATPGAAVWAIAAGGSHTCILLNDGNADCYGRNWFGEGGDYTGGDATAVTAGRLHTCVLKSSHNVFCYGYTGDGAAAAYTGGDATAVDAGWYHTCVLKSNANVDCYGDNSYGQSADYTGGDAIAVSAGGLLTCVQKGNGNVHCYGNVNADYTGGDAQAVSAGGQHFCVLTTAGNVSCFGPTAYGAGYGGGDAQEIAAGDDFVCYLKLGGNASCGGLNTAGQAAAYDGLDYAIHLATGGEHACYQLDSGVVECQGSNADGQSAAYFAPSSSSAPTYLSAAIGPGQGEINLQWQKPYATGGFAILGYYVYRGAAAGAETFLTIVHDSSQWPIFTDTNLPDGTTWYYRVAAYNQAGRGPLSGEDHARTYSVPSAPLGLAAAPGIGTTTLTWLPPTDTGGGLDAYLVYRSTLLLDSGTLIAWVPGSQTAYVDTGCLLATVCTYTVTAYTPAGEGPPSNGATTVGTGVPL